MLTVTSRPGRAYCGLVLLGAVLLTAGCSLLHSGPSEINGLAYKCVVGTVGQSWADFRRASSGPAYEITITNRTSQNVRLKGYEVAQLSASGQQVNLDVYTSQDGTAGQLMPTQYIAPGQSFSNGDDTGVNAASCELAGWH
jgi:hypothetical protein